MAAINLDILNILIKCGCVQHAANFAGLTVDKLREYNFQDFMSILPPEASEQVARKIQEEVQRSRTQKEQEESREDDEVQILDVVMRNKGQPVTFKEETIDDQSDQQGIRPESSGTINSSENQSDTPSETTENDDSEDGFEIGPEIEIDPKKPNFSMMRKHDNVQLHITSDSIHKCFLDLLSIATLRRWARGMSKWGSKIYSVKMSTWTWQELTSPCPYNLFKILVNFCPTLHVLILTANINKTTDQHQMLAFPQNFKLPKLEVLHLCHDGDLTCLDQLKEILVAGVNLRKICYSFGVLKAVTSFLRILRGLTRDQLKNLKVLSIKSRNKKGCFTQMHFIHLAKIDAFSLEELELGNGLSEDVDGPTIEEILFRLPKLKRLTIDGCFMGSSQIKPKILIKFPVMNHLESIKIGGNYSYNSICEDVKPRSQPTKFRKGHQGDRINLSTSDMKISSFPVTLQFPILPNLNVLQLGNLFEIEDLHFASFPKLRRFFAGSRWDLSVSFPKEEKSRRSSYTLITYLQMPDCLDNPSFVKLIPFKFPNLTYCVLTLPTVKVLRTFFKEMANSEIKELRLITQFDFESTLDTCLLDKPTTIQVSQDELKKVKLLKQYGNWEEYVKFHHIELPEEDLSSLEGDDMAGLSSLKNLTTLHLYHERKILRIPKGNIHWTSPDCQFTGEFLGFREYPWSASCEQLRNDLMKKNLKDDRYLQYNNPFRPIREPDDLLWNYYQVEPMKIVAKDEDEQVE